MNAIHFFDWGVEKKITEVDLCLFKGIRRLFFQGFSTSSYYTNMDIYDKNSIIFILEGLNPDTSTVVVSVHLYYDEDKVNDCLRSKGLPTLTSDEIINLYAKKKYKMTIGLFNLGTIDFTFAKSNNNLSVSKGDIVFLGVPMAGFSHKDYPQLPIKII